jgi:DNA-binding NarL/FixJ family response regulator
LDGGAGARETAGDEQMDSDTFQIAEVSRPLETHPRATDRLTDRERQVVLRALRGGANKEIAYDLGLAHSTVRVFMARAALKLGAANRQELLQKAVGILSESE